MDLQAWSAALFNAIDKQDTESFLAFFAEECRFRFGNIPAVEGKEALRPFLQNFFDSIQSLSHQLIDSWSVPDAVIVHGFVTYTRHNGSTLQIPFSNVMKNGETGIEDYLIFADTSGLYLE